MAVIRKHKNEKEIGMQQIDNVSRLARQLAGVVSIALVSLLVSAMAVPAAQAASTFPDAPITMIVPYPPGGTTDITARAMAQAMGVQLKQAIVVENRAGAGGSIGMARLARAKADGYTIGMGTIGSQTINQFLYKDLAYNPETDFVPIALAVTTPNIIAVRSDSSIRTLADLIAAAKAAKGRSLSFASPGIGSSVHLTGAYLERAAGITMLHVPFKGASGSMPAVVGGQVDILIDNLPSTLALVRDGSKIRGIVVTSAQRSPSLPNIPTAAESGLPGFDVIAWFALYAPKGTPAPVVARLIEAAKVALASPALKAEFISVGAQAGTLFGPDLSKFERVDRARWGKLIADGHIEAQ
jgi:tripartite-type tricarboxylate transporter receptor subunit TctC